jgi:hypothetical protein
MHVEPHRTGHGLAVGKAAVRRHQPVGVLGRYLDEIAEHAVVADLQRGDTGLVAVFRLQRGDGAAGVARGLAQRVERVVVALGDVAALRPLGRRQRHQRAGVEVGQRAVSAQ